LTFGLGRTILEPIPFESGLSDTCGSYRLLNPTRSTVTVGVSPHVMSAERLIPVRSLSLGSGALQIHCFGHTAKIG